MDRREIAPRPDWRILPLQAPPAPPAAAGQPQPPPGVAQAPPAQPPVTLARPGVLHAQADEKSAVVRPLDAGVKLPEHARVIIVSSEPI